MKGLKGMHRFGSLKLDMRRDRGKILAILLALVGVNLLVYLGLILPRNRELGRLEREIKILDRGIREWEKTVKEQDVVLDRVRETNAHLDDFLLDRLSSKVEKMTSIQREVRKIAKKFGIDPESITYTHELVEDENLILFGMDVPLVGSYSSLRQFLHQIEISDHFLIIDRISLSGSKEGGTQLSLRIRLSTYFSTMENEPKEELSGPEDRA